MKSQWLKSWSVPTSRQALVCLPHAGAGASAYRQMALTLHARGMDVYVVQYPGREERISEPLITSGNVMVNAIAAECATVLKNRKVCIFGHSMGAVLGWELAHIIRRFHPGIHVVKLIMSGRNAPSVPPRFPPLHALPPSEFLTSIVERYQSFPSEVLADPEMRELIASVLRADITVVELHRPTQTRIDGVPIAVFSGSNDPFTSQEGILAWSSHTTSECRFRSFPGGHFFLFERSHDVISAIECEVPHLCKSAFDR